MDPEAALINMREAVMAVRSAVTVDDLVVESDNLANAADALDDWLKSGGFLPLEWSRLVG